jgi:A/G-specific adenine glycosylase
MCATILLNPNARNPVCRYAPTHTAILDWYAAHGRHDLPWRQTRDPYRIYLSEIMLQQTQVGTVQARFYFPFLERFATLADVAEAHEDAVLKAWEGLGYYTRARNLHKTAKMTGGTLPQTAAELEALPGIGRSTASAIACFAHGEAVPILDANVRRILYRFFRRRQADSKTLWRMAERLFDSEHPYEYNQTLMDIGAILCTPQDPDCDACPLRAQCRGHTHPERYPAPKPKKSKPTRRRTLLIYTDGERYGLRKAQERLLGGLYGWPQVETDVIGRVLGRVAHHYSHFTLDAQVVLTDELPDEPVALYALGEIEALPLSGADRKALACLHSFTLH